MLVEEHNTGLLADLADPGIPYRWAIAQGIAVGRRGVTRYSAGER